MRMPRRTVVAITLLLACATITACSGADITWVAEGNDYSRDEAREVADGIETPDVAERPTSDAPELRHEALSALRGKGDQAAEAADLLTRTFDSQTRAVPVYVELGAMDGRPVLVMVEAWGPREGTLEHVRTWVLDAESGEVLDASSAR